jgi:hypothetical protein
MAHGVGSVLWNPVTIDTGDTGMGVSTVFPVLHLPRGGLLVTAYTGPAFFGHTTLDFQDFGVGYIDGAGFSQQAWTQGQPQQSKTILQQGFHDSSPSGNFFQPNSSRW